MGTKLIARAGAIAPIGLSMKQATEATGLGRTTLWKAVGSGQLQCFRVGRRVLFSPEHLERFLKLHERNIRMEASHKRDLS